MKENVHDFIDKGRKWAEKVKPEHQDKVFLKAQDKFFNNTKSDPKSVKVEMFWFGVMRKLEEEIWKKRLKYSR